MERRWRRHIEEYQDTMVRLYPELHVRKDYESTKNADRILSRNVTFQVTDACNLACTYCYQHNKGTRRMSRETAFAFVDMLLDRERTGDYINPDISPFVIIEFIGGEPFLEVGLIDETIQYWQMRTMELQHPWATRYMVSICSNGVLYRSPEVQRFIQKHARHLSLSVTLDGTKELHDACRVFPDGRGSYDLAADACKDLISRGIDVGSKITIAPGNIEKLSDALKFMVEFGYSEINANCVFEEGWDEGHASELYRQMKVFSDYLFENDLEYDVFCSLYEESAFKPLDEDNLDLWCGGDGMMLSCDPDGYLYPCIRYMESSLGDEVPPIRIGHVSTGIGKSPEEAKLIRCMDCITRRSMSSDECFYCPIAEGCAWCAAYNYEVNGKLDSRATFICPMHKARALGNAYFWNMYHIKHGDAERFKVHVPREWAVPIIGEEEYEWLLWLSGEPGERVEK